MTIRSWTGRGCAVLMALVLQACGGGGNSDPATAQPSSVEQPVIVDGVLKAQAFDSNSGATLSNVTVTVAGQNYTTDASGNLSVTLKQVQGKGLSLQATKNGYALSVSRVDVPNNGTTTVKLMLTPVAAQGSLPVISGGTVSVPGTPAQVTLPANGVVDAETGNAITGNVNVAITPIDPARQPASMPGSFLSRTDTGTQAIESFGAINVQLTDAGGRKLQLAKGAMATLRVPVKTRSTVLPKTIWLYYLDDTTGLWVHEGEATLSADGSYYEGKVSHFSSWNCDYPIESTIYVEGCVRNPDNGLPPVGTVVWSDGMDYSGTAYVNVDSQGNFRVPMKKGGMAAVTASYDNIESPTALITPNNTDIKLNQCLVLKAFSPAPEIIQDLPATQMAYEGEATMLIITARGTGTLRYEWMREGEAIPGQNSPRLFISKVGTADNGKVYSVKITNSAGLSKTSSGTTLTVVPNGPAEQQRRLGELISEPINALTLAMAPSNTADMDVAVMLNPARICSAGSASNVTLEGNPVKGGEPVSPDASHLIGVSFDNCLTDEETFTGKALANFSYSISPGNTVTLNSSTQMLPLTDVKHELTGKGVFNVTTVAQAGGISTSTLTPEQGAVLMRVNTTRTMTFQSGSIVSIYNDQTQTVTSNFQQVRYVLNGHTYIVNGSMTAKIDTTTQSTGLITVSRDGILVGNWKPTGPEVLPAGMGLIDLF